jgi:hypothetical protein
MNEEPTTMLLGAGGVSVALASALRCAGPLIAVLAGVSGAGLAARVEPLRPWFLGAAFHHRYARDVGESRRIRAASFRW